MIDDLGDSPSMDPFDARAARFLHVAAWVVALVVFELTADPSLAVLVGCSKFGWEQLRAARWLRKSDPIPARGRACRWFYVSWGLWRISIVATLMMFVVLLVSEGLRHALGAAPRKGNMPPPQFVVSLLIAFFGFLFSTLTTIFGVVSAWRSRARVWVGHAAIDAFRARTWPPIESEGDVMNRMAGLLFTAVPIATVAGLIPVGAIVVGIASTIAGSIGGERAVAIAMFVGIWVCLMGIPAAFLLLVDAAKRRMEANSPAECWPVQEAIPPPSNQMTFGNALR